MARRVPEGQAAFDFDGPPAPEAPEAPAPRTWGWEWWDPLPPGWTDRQCYIRQIARDMRAIEEAEAMGPGFDDEVPFFRGRIESFREALRKMDGEGQ